ncbi:MAG: Ig-like domain-containing protein [Candidatus Nealsonbacteria bacterium]|nr:Ig-like domain-containing protein [Candidatus Nealsonbacteria bacterium]
MATRFMRVDLSDDARDFRPIALEPGVPMLDRSNANAKILFRWLGGMVGEPVWEGESVNFFVRDDHGGRLEEAVCQPASAEDLRSTLQGELDALKQRIEQAKPETPTERLVKKMARRSFAALIDDPGRTDLDSYFVRYKDANGNWRLVWAWGYQRVDQQPAPAVVCTDPECALLFVRRPGQSPKCPACEAALATGPAKRKFNKRKVLVALLLLLLAAGLYYWWTHPDRLVATPTMHNGPVGARVQFKIERVGLIPFWTEDVTRQAVGVMLDPAVAQFDQASASAVLNNPGTTELRFHLGELAIYVPLSVLPALNPDKILIEPGDVELAIGTTARLKLTGQYKDGSKADLTDAAEWTAGNDGIVYSYEGLLEGLAEGKTTVGVRYRADARSEYLDASVNVTVVNAKLKSLEVAVAPDPVGVGQSSDLTIDAVSDKGKRYSVLESSLLATEVGPDYLAAVEGRRLAGRHVGRGKLSVTFDDRLKKQIEFSVDLYPGLDGLVVTPESLEMVVGQITDLNVVSASNTPIRVSSADPTLVEITGENRLVGRAVGKAKVEVAQGNQRKTIEVTVTSAEFLAIAIDPARLVVPIDDTIRPRVLARIKGKDKADRNVEIAPDLLVCDTRPSGRYADFYLETMELHGIWPTDPSSPQMLALRLGKHRASARVEVVLAPFRLTLTPPGPVELPHGQQMRMQGWATYNGGRRVQVLPHRLAFDGQLAADGAEGLEVRGNRVAALEPGAGPLSVSATYHGTKSKPVTFKSVEADPTVKLQLEAGRTLRVVGETGQAVLSATCPQGDVELVPELAQFNSSDAAALKIDETSGMFRAMAPAPDGVLLTATHPAAAKSAEKSTSVSLEVYDPANARLVFDPDAVHVAVDEVARLPLFLEVQDEGKPKRARLTGPGVGYAVEQPEAIRFAPPMVVGVEPTIKPLKINASYYPYLTSIATATVEVEAIGPDQIRMVPSAAEMAPGQTVAFQIQQALPKAANKWKEVRGDAIAWTVPKELIWSPATEDLRPTATIPEGASGEFELKAEFGGKLAIGRIKIKAKGPNPNDKAAEVLVLREPQGRYLPVGSQQRYSIAVKKNGQTEPVANVEWPPDFENEYVRWEAPVLTAKQPGHQQWFRSEVDGRIVLFHTTTYQPGQFDQAPPREDRPEKVEILTDQQQPVQFPVGAEFDDFRVVIHFPDGFTRLVTKKATLRTSQPPSSAPLTASMGRLVGVRPGATEVHAEFDGVSSVEPLRAVVTAEVDVDEIRIAPAPVALQQGESYALEIRGYKGGNSVGIITGLGQVTWKSADENVARMAGPTVTGVANGNTQVTATFNGLASAAADVHVGTIADGLTIAPGLIRIRVGEAARIGAHLSVFRGDMDLSAQCNVTPAIPDVVQYVPETHSLVGRSPGASAVAFTYGDKLANVMVEVLPAVNLVGGEVVIEPSGGTLVPGQALDLRVFVVGPDGRRIDRTDAAVLSSSDPSKVAIRGNFACALAPAAADVTVTATLPELQTTGTAYVQVADGPITELVVEPPALQMSTGELRRLRILGRAASGTHDLFPQPSLKLTPAGANPGAIRIVGASDVDAVAAGSAEVAVSWQDRLNGRVHVTVSNDVLRDLRIEPAAATIHPGQPLVYQVTALQGGQRRVLGPEHGVKLYVGEQSIAEAAPNALAVRGNQPGRTSVVAKIGDQQATATLDVVPGTAPVGVGQLVDVPGGVIYGPGGGYRGGPGGWTEEHWRGGPGWVEWGYGGPGGHVVGGVVVPSADVRELRFVPEVLRLSPNSPATSFRVVEVLTDGSDGRDITNATNLQVNATPAGVVQIGQDESGRSVQPAGQGQTRLGATLTDADGETLLARPMLVSVGDVMAVPGRLLVQPDPLTVWAGETAGFSSVLLDPGGGQPLRPIAYRVIPSAGQNVIESVTEQTVRGLAPGGTNVVVAAVDPAGPYDGASTNIEVRVISGERLEIRPAAISLQIGQPTPPMSVVTVGTDGQPFEVPATLESMNGAVLSADPAVPGRFVAQALGETQIRASYRGRDAFATVSVSGQRFVQVSQKLNSGTDDFGVAMTVLAAQSENPLQYRAYVAGQAPEGVQWTPAESLADGSQQVTVHSPRMQFGPPNSLYNLIIEAKDTTDGSVQQYPFTFRLRPEIERTDRSNTPPNVNTLFE